MYSYSVACKMAVLAIAMLFVLPHAFGQAKPGTVKGAVADTSIHMKLPGATVRVLKVQDSAQVVAGQSTDNGSFTLRQIPVGKYILEISYTGYTSLYKSFAVSADKPANDFGELNMEPALSLDDVVVTAKPIVVKGDTVEYNAAAFQVNKPNAVVEDMLKKMPGVEVDENGVIKVNGKEVKQVMVDGKKFFTNDPKLASKNLRADMIHKVQVFEKKSDRSEFTGFDDGNGEPTINLTLKPDKRNGYFGKVSGGIGNDGFYKAEANIHKFSKGEQIAFTGQANNINQQNFGRGSGFGGNGITTTQAAGINYNNFKNSKLDLNSSYFFNHTQNDNQSETRRETNLGDSLQLRNSTANTMRSNYSHNLNISADWKIDSFNSIKISPVITYSTSENRNQRQYATNSSNGILLNDGFTNTASKGTGYNISGSLLWRHKFSRKGRTLSLELKGGTGQNDNEGSQYTLNTLLTKGTYTLDTIDQRNYTNNSSNSYSVTAGYTEPIGQKAVIEINAYHNRNADQNDKSTYDKNYVTGAYDIKNDTLTNYFENDYYNSGTSLNYRHTLKGWDFMVGTKFQHSMLSSLLQGKADPIDQSFFNILPNAMLHIGSNRFNNFRMFYNGNTSQPSVRQLQPVADISDPLHTIQGNPNLKQSFTHNVRGEYNIINQTNSRSLAANFSANQTSNAVVSRDSIMADGGRYTSYENVSGIYSVNGGINLGIPFKWANGRINLNTGTNGGFNRNINYQNGQNNIVSQNIIRNLNVGQRISANLSYKDWLELGIGGRAAWNRARYSVSSAQNTDFYNYTANFNLDVTLPLDFLISVDVRYNANEGRAAGFNTSYTLLNAAIAKLLFANKKGEIRFEGNDLLNQNTGISRNTNGNYVEDSRFTVMKRYFLLTFTYNLSKFGKGNGNRGPGGPGGERGGGGGFGGGQRGGGGGRGGGRG